MSLEFPIPKRDVLIQFAIDTCKEYRDEGYAITLRQLYYQGVSRKVLPSGQEAYDRLKEVLSEARLAGKFPLWAIVDRTRVIYQSDQTRADDNVDRAFERSTEAVRALPASLLVRARWLGQDHHVSVFFEKEALAGIFEGVCDPLGVGTFSCHGDSSHAGIYDWLRKAAHAHGIDNPKGWRDDADNFHKGTAKKSIILYFGDCDPTGMRIPKTIERTLRRFQQIAKTDFPVEFVRVGLSVEMARDLDLPPFWAKASAGKDYDDYVEAFGTTEAWELDAVPPKTLEALTRDAIATYFDKVRFQALQTGIEQRRALLRERMRTTEWHIQATAPLDE